MGTREQGIRAPDARGVYVRPSDAAEAIENVDRRPSEGVRAAGGGKLQVLRLGVLPQVLPVLLSNVLYYFESNIRSASILGIVGAGGIGYLLSDRISANNWDEVMSIILLLLITVGAIDAVSRALRAKIIGGDARSARRRPPPQDSAQ